MRLPAPLRSACVLVLPASGLVAAGGSVAPYGSGCGPAPPSLALQGTPAPGADVTVVVGDLGAGAAALLLVGTSSEASAFGPLPLALPSPPFAPGCELLVSAELQVALAAAGGVATLEATLAPELDDVHVHLQAAAIAADGEVALSAALDVHVLAPAGGVAGAVTEAAGGAPVEDARVTLFTPDLSVYLERRTDAAGGYAFAGVPPGAYRLGVAALGRAYEERGVAVAGGALAEDFALVPESEPGRWSVVGDTLPETLDATDIGLVLPDGRILYCHDTTDPIVFDPLTGAKTFPPPSGSSQGCMNGTLLADGSALLVGGQDGADPASFTDAIPWVKRLLFPSLSWLQQADMLAPNGRWYPGLARLADGRVLVMGGGTAPAAERTDTCELHDPFAGTWTWTGSMGSPNEFAPAALLHDGRVLRTWGEAPETYDPATGTWSPTGPLAFPARGYPGHSDHSLLVLADRRALVVGVRTTDQPDAEMTEVLDPATSAWTAGTSPSLRRMQCEVVLLPDGRVLVQGGDEHTLASPEPDVLGIVRRVDLLDPSDLSWRRVADTPRYREYHAVTLLVPDGRVLTTGGTNIQFSGGPLSADVDAYEPPYLFRGVRPTLSALSDDAPSRGATLTFQVAPATELTHAVLLGLPSTTHWVDGGVPRRIVLPVASAGGATSATLPTDPAELPVGWYLLFGMVDDIPSPGLVLRVDP